VCFPVLMEEVGSNNDGVRKLIRDLLRKATQVYPTSKIFSFLLDAAHVTRNQRSRAECLSEMTALVERLGLDQVDLAIHINSGCHGRKIQN
jgi:cytoskeleton-associated protein 5